MWKSQKKKPKQKTRVRPMEARIQCQMVLESLCRSPGRSRVLEKELATSTGLATDPGCPIKQDLYLQGMFARVMHVAIEAESDSTSIDSTPPSIESILDYGITERTDMTVTCRNCKSTSVRCEARQTRSADEAPTLFFHCRGCGSKWRCYC